MDIPIIFENDDLLVIDKPAGLTVNKAESTKGQETVQEWVREHCHSGLDPESITIDPGLRRDDIEFAQKNGIVHRLDKDTSGLLVIAKNLKSYLNLKSQFQNRTVEKKYLALVHGIVTPIEGEINVPIDRNPFNRTHFGVFSGGREAITNYKMLKQVQHDSNIYSFVEVFPKTGRTHQIRVHFKWINHPLVGDPLYGGRKNYQADQKFCPRLFLHASYLKISGFELNSPLPKELQILL